MKKITLGWLRVVLAFMVIDLHYGIFREIFDHFATLENNTSRFYFCGDGNIAVSGFFIMSGYLVSEILRKKYPSNSRRDFFHFVASRYLRILPLYLFVLCGYLLVMFSLGHRYNSSLVVFNAALLPYGLLDYFSSSLLYRHFLIIPAWTLSLDLVSYPIGFILLKQRKYLIGTAVILLVYYVFVWIYSPTPSGTMSFNATASWWHERFYTTIQPNMLAFVMGMLANLYFKDRKLPAFALYAGIFLLLYVCYLPLFIGYFGAQFIGMISLVLIASSLAKNGMSKYESLFGSFTFAIYLIHRPVLDILRPYIDQAKVTTFFINIALAFIIAIFVEEKFVEFRRREWLRKWRPTGDELAASFTKYNALALTLLLGSIMYYYLIFFVR